MMSKYLQVVWLYVIGILIIFVGLYLLIIKSGPSSFMVMLVGLGISAMGAAHGRRMKASGDMDLEELMRKKGLIDDEPEERPQKPVESATPQMEEPKMTEPAAPREEEKEEDEPKGRLRNMLRRQEGKSMPEQILEEMEMADIKSGKLLATQADEIELVCPKCAAANEEKNFFCFNCGNKLRRKSIKEARGEEAPNITFEPGTIKVVGQKKVAKVLICSRCNAANRESDRFCFNCGKKLKPERTKLKPGKA